MPGSPLDTISSSYKVSAWRGIGSSDFPAVCGDASREANANGVRRPDTTFAPYARTQGLIRAAVSANDGDQSTTRAARRSRRIDGWKVA